MPQPERRRLPLRDEKIQDDRVVTARPDIFVWYMALVGIPRGCSVNPVCTRPTVPIPGSRPGGPACRNVTSNERSVADTPWRRFCTEDEHQKVITRALENNRALRPADLSPGLSPEVLLRRSHILAAEAQLWAANQVGLYAVLESGAGKEWPK